MKNIFNFVDAVQFNEMPELTAKRVKHSLLDIVGILAATSRNSTVKAAQGFALKHFCGTPADTTRLFFNGASVSTLGAAWVGGFGADSLDGHEGHFLSKGHAGATVVPSLLILADAYKDAGHKISGHEFLSLLAIGYETSLRAGVSLIESTPYYPASGAFSGIGVVLAGGRMMSCNPEVIEHALGIAEYFSPRCPMMRVVDYPTMLRDAHSAGAYSGINALYLAQAGITGAPAETLKFEQSLKYWQDLGQSWEIDNQYYKPWPVCRWAQPALTAIERLLNDQPEICGNAIETIRIETFHESTRLQGYTPKNRDEAEYGLAYPVAAMVHAGKFGPEQLTDEFLVDENVLALAKKVEIVESEELSQRFPSEILSRVEIRLKTGETFLSPITQAKGDPETPMSESDFLDKFYINTKGVLTEEHRDALLEELLNLEHRQDISRLLELIFKPSL